MSFQLDPATHSLIAPRIILRIADNRTTEYPPNSGPKLPNADDGGWVNTDWSGAPLTSTPTPQGKFDTLAAAIAAV